MSGCCSAERTNSENRSGGIRKFAMSVSPPMLSTSRLLSGPYALVCEKFITSKNRFYTHWSAQFACPHNELQSIRCFGRIQASAALAARRVWEIPDRFSYGLSMLQHCHMARLFAAFATPQNSDTAARAVPSVCPMPPYCGRFWLRLLGNAFPVSLPIRVVSERFAAAGLAAGRAMLFSAAGRPLMPMLPAILRDVCP